MHFGDRQMDGWTNRWTASTRKAAIGLIIALRVDYMYMELQCSIIIRCTCIALMYMWYITCT